MRKSLILTSTFMILSCATETKESLEKTRKISFDSCESKEIKEDTINMKGINRGTLMVRDSLLFMTCHNHPTHFMFVYNRRDNSIITSLFPKGHSEHEYTEAPSFCYQIVEMDNEWGYWIYNIHAGTYQLVNMSKSVATGKTVVDSTITFNYIRQFQYPFGRTFFSKNKMLGRMQEIKQGEKAVPVKYYVCDPKENCVVIDTIEIYRNAIQEESITHSLSSCDVFNESTKKISMPMQWMPQINIVDIQNKCVTKLRLSSFGNKHFNPGLNKKELKNFYIDAISDGKYIYMLYANGKKGITVSSNVIHVIDWEGNPVMVLNTATALTEIYVDKTTNTLYGRDVDDNYYQYKL